MTERWLPIPDWEDLYEVSDEGRVRSLPRIGGGNYRRRQYGGKMLAPCPDSGGYPSVRLCRPGKQVLKKVANLVALAFLGPKPFPRAAVCHNDGDKTNSRLSNLRYDTYSANEKDKLVHGTHPKRNKEFCPQNHPYDEANTYVHPKTGHRTCRTCTRDGQARNKKPAVPRPPVLHGTTSRYTYGCRCDECREANSAYHKEWRRKRREEAA